MGQLLSKRKADVIDASDETAAEAVKTGNVKKLKCCIKDDLEENWINGIKGTSLLHLAVRLRQVDCIKTILAHRKDPDVTNALGWSPMFSIFNDQIDTRKKPDASEDLAVIGILLKAKADINARNSAQRTPLFKSIINREKHITDYLLAHNADVNIGDVDGLLPIHVCATSSSVPLLRTLLENGADINGQDKRGRTALYYSILSGHREIFDELIANGCDVNICSVLGCPLQVAVVCCREEMVKILLNNGASVYCAIKESRFGLRKASDILDLAITILQTQLTKLSSSSGTSGSMEKVQSAISILELIIQAQGSNTVITYNPFFQINFQINVLQNLADAKITFKLQNICQKLGFLISMSKQKLPAGLQTGTFKVDETFLHREALSLQNLCRIRVRKLVMKSRTNVIACVKKLDCSLVIKDILLLKDIFKIR